MNDNNHLHEIGNYNALESTPAPCASNSSILSPSILTFLSNKRYQCSIDDGLALDDIFNGRCGSPPGDINPERSLPSQTTSFLTDGNTVDGWGVSDDLELKTAGETDEISQWPSDYFGGGPPEMGTPPNPLSSTEPVEWFSQDDDMAAELDPFILGLPTTFILSLLRSDPNLYKQVLKTITENIELALSTNDTKSLPNSQGGDYLADSTGEPATTTLSADYILPGPSSSSSVGQANAASNRTGGPATTTEFFCTPPNHGQLPSHSPQSMAQAVVKSGFLDQLIPINGVTAPVAHFPTAEWHQDMYAQQPLTAPADVGRHANAQMGGGYPPYNPVAQATVARGIQAYAGAMVPVFRANPPLPQAPIIGAFSVYDRQPRNLSATTRAQATRRETRHDPYKLSSASKCAETSGEPKLYYCQWGDCSEGPMVAAKIFEHFRAHGERNRETGEVKACQWAGCDPKPDAFPMSFDSFRRHVNETQSHARIGSLTKIKCKKCGKMRARRSMHSHKKSCSKEKAG